MILIYYASLGYLEQLELLYKSTIQIFTEILEYDEEIRLVS